MERKHYKQPFNYGCGIYALANVLQDEEFITDENINNSVNGNNVGQLNKLLLDNGYDCFVDKHIYINEVEFDIYDLKPNMTNENDNVIGMPFFIVVKYSETINHMMGCIYMRDMSIVVHDSLKYDLCIYQNFADFSKAYPKIVSLEVIVTFDNKFVIVTDE